MTVEGHTLLVGAISFVVGWLAARGPARLRRGRDQAAAFLEGYEKGQDNATRFFADGGKPGVKPPL